MDASHFSFSDEQREFRAVLRRYFADKSPATEVRRLMETELGWDPAAWAAMNRDLGLCGVHVPEAYGGQGFGFAELAIVVEEMGRALVCAPYFASAVMAAGTVLSAGTENEKRRLLPGIASGEVVATLAIAEDSGCWDPAGVTATAIRDGGGFRLSGHKSFVLDGRSAGLIIVLARRPGTAGADGLTLFTVAGDAPGLERRALPTLDQTRRLARLSFDGAPAAMLGEEGAAAAPVARALDHAAICLANETVGVAERLREDSLAYTKLRVQFGRQIASFQAIKHRAAEMLLDVELAKSAAYYAAAAAALGDDDLPAVAALAKAGAADACMRTAIEAIQLHGGIGFTWDNDTHLWFKRAKCSEVLLGSPSWHRERMMRHWAA